jgi:hypothetical protein
MYSIPNYWQPWDFGLTRKEIGRSIKLLRFTFGYGLSHSLGGKSSALPLGGRNRPLQYSDFSTNLFHAHAECKTTSWNKILIILAVAMSFLPALKK